MATSSGVSLLRGISQGTIRPTSTGPQSVKPNVITRSLGGGGGGSTTQEQIIEEEQSIVPPVVTEVKKPTIIEKAKTTVQQLFTSKDKKITTTGTTAQQVATNIKQPITLSSYDPNKQMPTGTKITSDYGKVNVPLYSPGTIYQGTTGSFQADGRNIPTVGTYTVNPDWSSRRATPEEYTSLEQYKKETAYEETALKPTPSKLSRTFGEVKGSYGEFSRQELYDTGRVENFFSKGGTTGRFVGGVITGFVPSTKGQLVTTGLLAGVSMGLGSLTKVGSFALSKSKFASKIFTPTVKSVGKSVGKIGSYTFGGTYASIKGYQIYSAPTAFKKGEILGKTSRELLVSTTAFNIGAGRNPLANFKSVQEGKLFEKAPTKLKAVNIQGDKGGVIQATATKTTSPNWLQRNILRIKPKQIVTEYTQPYTNIGENRIIMEGGKGITYELGGNKFSSTLFKSSGRGIGNLPVTTGTKTLRLSQQEILGSVGRVTIRPTVTATGRISKAGDIIKWEGTAKASTEKITKPFISATKSNEDITYLLGGKASKVRIYTGRETAISNINVYGKIKNINKPSTDKGFSLSGIGRTSPSTVTTTSPSFVQTLTEESLSLSKPSITGFATNKISGVGTKIVTATKTSSPFFNKIETNQLSQEKLDSKILPSFAPVLKNLNTPDVKVKTFNVPTLSLGQTPITKQRVGVTTATSISEVPITTTKQITKPIRTQKPSSSFTPPTFTTIPTGVPPFSLPSPGMPSGLGLRDIKVGRKYSYTPSYGAIVKGITSKGKAPKGTTKFSGLETRPIYSGTKTKSKSKTTSKNNKKKVKSKSRKKR